MPHEISRTPLPKFEQLVERKNERNEMKVKIWGTAGYAARISFLLILFACFYALLLFISLDVQVPCSSLDLCFPQRILLFISAADWYKFLTTLNDDSGMQHVTQMITL